MSTADLFDAIHRGSFIEVCQLIRGGVDLNVFSESGASALQVSADLHQFSICMLLLIKGADPSIKNQEDGTTPLQSICEYNEEMSRETGKLLDMMFEKNVDVNAKDCNGNTAMHRATGNNSSLYIRWLIGHGAKCCIVNKKHQTPLYVAVRRQSQRIIAQLLNAGSNINQLDFYGETMLHEFTRVRDTAAIVTLLTHGIDDTIRNYDRHTAHGLAVLRGDQHTAELISHTVTSLRARKRKFIG